MRALALTPSLLLFVLAAPAHAFTWPWEQKKPTKRVTVDVSLSYDLPDVAGLKSAGVYAAQGLRVSAYTHEILGFPRIIGEATTDAAGRASFAIEVREGEKIKLLFETDNAVCKTYPAAWNVLYRPHRDTLTFSARESWQERLVVKKRWSGEMNRAVMVHDYATRTNTVARVRFAAVLKSFNKIKYAFPAIIFTSSHSFTSGRVGILDDDHNRHPDAIMHETGHTLWYQARGDWFELYAPFKHSYTSRSGNQALAMSEGFANVFAIWMGDTLARIHGRPELADQGFMNFGGEVHACKVFTKVPVERWREWGDDSEANITTALWDLIDTAADDHGPNPGRDVTNGQNGLPSGDAAMRRIFEGVKNLRRKFRIHFVRDLWEEQLAPIYGDLGRATLYLNGIETPGYRPPPPQDTQPGKGGGTTSSSSSSGSGKAGTTNPLGVRLPLSGP